MGLGGFAALGFPFMVAIAILWAYICVVTYLFKLIPLYGGHAQGRNTLRETIQWYLSHHRS